MPLTAEAVRELGKYREWEPIWIEVRRLMDLDMILGYPTCLPPSPLGMCGCTPGVYHWPHAREWEAWIYNAKESLRARGVKV